MTAVTEMSLDRFSAFRAQLLPHEPRKRRGVLRAFGGAGFDVFLQIGGPQPLSCATQERTDGIRRQPQHRGRISGRYPFNIDECERALPGVGESFEGAAQLISLCHLGGEIARFAVGKKRQHIGFDDRRRTNHRRAPVRFGANSGHEIRLEGLIRPFSSPPRAPDLGESLGDGIFRLRTISAEAQCDMQCREPMSGIELTVGGPCSCRFGPVITDAGTEVGVAEFTARVWQSERGAGTIGRR
nr:hypothetical protein [Brevibacterium sediminis]